MEDPDRKMICVTGTPGVGKTTFSRNLAHRLGVSHVDLNKWLVEHGYSEGIDKDRGSIVIDEEKLAGLKIPGVIDSHLSHFCNCDAIIVLRAPYQKEHLKRMQKKGWSAKKVRENLEAEIMEIIAEEAREIFSERGIPVLEIAFSDLEGALERAENWLEQHLSFPSK